MKTAEIFIQGFFNLFRKTQTLLCIAILTGFASGQELILPAGESGNGAPPKAISAANLNSQLDPPVDDSNQTPTNNDTIRPFLARAVLETETGDPPEPDQAKLAEPAATFETVATTELPPREENLVQVQAIQQEPVSSNSFSLTDLESLAFKHNPTLAAAKARVSAMRGQQLQSGLYPNPVVGYQGMEMGVRGTAGQQGGFIGQRIITGGKLDLDQAAAGKQVSAAHFEFHAQEQRVLSDVRVRFYETVILQQRVKLTNELVRIGDELVRATEQLLDARQATQNDLLLAEIQVDESRILLDNSYNDEIQSWRRLAAVIGLPAMQPVALTGPLENDSPPLDWATCYSTVMDNNPVLNTAKAKVEHTKILVLRAKKEPIPDIDLMVRHRYHNVTGDNVTTVQAGIPLPLFNRNQGNIRSAEAQWRAANKERERIELELQDQLAVAFRRYTNATQQTKRYKDRMIPRAEKSLRLVTAGYEKGQVQYLTLLTAQRTYWQVSLSYLDSLRELHTTTSLIQGQLLSGSLTPHKSTKPRKK